MAQEGQNIRKSYQRRLPSDTSKDYYFMQRDTGNTESVTIEYGFLDSTGDDIEQLKQNWENYAEAVVRALLEYLNIEYVPIKDSGYYVVQKGDTLWGIAKKNNVTVDKIKEVNNLTNNLLSIGQVIKIPNEDNETSNYYVVQKGDSLYKIANRYGTTVDELIRLNNLSTTLLSIGQKLKLPNEEKNYVVQKGDTLYKIANSYGTTVNELMRINNLNTTILSIGQIIKLK